MLIERSKWVDYSINMAQIYYVDYCIKKQQKKHNENQLVIFKSVSELMKQ